jgi:hypothetical protein
MPLIGISGLKGSGKTTAASYLCTHLCHVTNGDWQIRSFADPLKNAVADLFDIPREHIEAFKATATVRVKYAHDDGWPVEVKEKLNGRTILQRMGTEVGRSWDENFWVDMLLGEYRDDFGDCWIIPDTRFANEAKAIKDRGGYVVRINRPGLYPDGHASETPLDDGWIDAEFINDGATFELGDQVINWFDSVFRSGNTAPEVEPRGILESVQKPRVLSDVGRSTIPLEPVGHVVRPLYYPPPRPGWVWLEDAARTLGYEDVNDLKFVLSQQGILWDPSGYIREAVYNKLDSLHHATKPGRPS